MSIPGWSVLLLALSVGFWRWAPVGRRPWDRMLLRWLAGVSLLLAALGPVVPGALVLVRVIMGGLAVLGLLAWVTGRAPLLLDVSEAASRRSLVLESLALGAGALVAALLLS